MTEPPVPRDDSLPLPPRPVALGYASSPPRRSTVWPVFRDAVRTLAGVGLTCAAALVLSAVWLCDLSGGSGMRPQAGAAVVKTLFVLAAFAGSIVLLRGRGVPAFGRGVLIGLGAVVALSALAMLRAASKR